MAAAVVLVLGLIILGVIAFVVRFIATLTLLALAIILFVTIGAYAFSFLGLYFILGEQSTGWAIFGAMLIGSAIVSALLQKARKILSKARAD